ncbi:MAG: hypothetical protein ACLUFL_01965 [Flavonifractor plautii]
MMALTVLSPVLGLVLKPATSTTMLSMYLATLRSGVAGPSSGLLTIFELSLPQPSGHPHRAVVSLTTP